jgi:hypothetical protein
MKRFIIKAAIFISSSVMLIAVLILSGNAYIRKKASFVIDPNTKYIILGHSHPQCAFNDSLIDSFKNFATSGECYLYTSVKCRKLIEENKNIEAVFVEFTNNQVWEEMNEWLWGKAQLEHYVSYSPFLNLEDHKMILVHNPYGFINIQSACLNMNFRRVVNQDFNYPLTMGGYLYLVRNKADSLLKGLKTPVKDIDKNISEANVAYLEKLVSFCESHQKKIFFIRSPMHPLFTITNESSLKNFLQTKFKGIEYLDFRLFPLPNSDFADLEHLNYQGAKKFSSWFNTLVHDGLLTRPDKQQFINERMKKMN